jgi:predicted HicB family RNase H-like nuclease
MKYKGYLGHITYDDEAKLFHGEVVGLKDVITFQGTTVANLQKAFKDSVEDYLAWCKEQGEKPEKTFSGKLNVRMSPELHAQLALEASQKGISLNDLINERLSR